MLLNQAKNLTKIDFPQIQQLRQRLQEIDQLIDQAKGIGFQQSAFEAQFKNLFPSDLSQLGEAAERGRSAAWHAGTTKGGGAPAPSAGAESGMPQWASRLQSEQAARHRRQMAVHTIREGDRGGASATPDISEKE